MQWKGYPRWCCSIEPEGHLTRRCLDALQNPPRPSNSRISSASLKFLVAVQKKLASVRKSNGLLVVDFDLDIARWVFMGRGEEIAKSWILCQESDFERLDLPERWYVGSGYLGRSIQIEFPVRVKPTLRIKKAPHISPTGIPLETLRVYFVTRGAEQ